MQGRRQKSLQEQLQTQILSRRFLSLQKPETAGGENDADMASYRADKEALQKYRRTCILSLDIVDSIARETRTDILQLDKEEKIREWYQKLKNLYTQYCRKKASDPLSDEEKMIRRVLGHYEAPDNDVRFLLPTVLQFNDTIDILQHRHLELLRRNQSREQGAGAGNDARAQEPFYSVKDLKLFERIEEALRSGSDIAFDTRELSSDNTGKNGESEAKGMVGTHVYAILNTRRIAVNDQERLYFVVMNPWAEQGVVYDVDAAGTRERSVRGEEDDEKEEGVFYLDLNRFAEIVKHWDFVSA